MTVASLEERLDGERFGGKAAQLATAARAGLPVPAGVALSSELVEALAAGEPAASAALAQAWSRLRPPLAARSSALGEDSEAVSFAGQHLTSLNVRTPADAMSAVKLIWRSAHADSTLAYRRRLGLDERPRIAVLLQELVDAVCAGVLFTRNPLGGADELVVEAAWGLGEAVVGGLVTPDRFRVARDGTVLERVAGEKDLAVMLAPEGGTRQVSIPRERVETLSLDDRQLGELARLAQACERIFSGARDLEWAFAGDHVYLLQCRAVTRIASLAR
ncbi:MAG TPA: PEP/pyruvate-binding domain-containing protein [Gaiellaceae bacterium]|jgi:pyruvate,water dikinase|nr:PEP/pyruvate-binding domain-containing protein [Gaiellaceae bacterium]